MHHSDDDVALFVPLIDIAVRVDNLLQRIVSIDDRFDLPCFDKLFDENKIVLCLR